jgi:hypothetical protein
MTRRWLLVLGIVAAGMGIAHDASAEKVCVLYSSNPIPPGMVAEVCAAAQSDTGPYSPLNLWRTDSAAQLALSVTPVPPATKLPPAPSAITDCSSVPANDPNRPGFVYLKICGSTRMGVGWSRPIRTPGKPTKLPNPCTDRTSPCPGRPPISSVSPMSPGLLEGDTGFANKGPAPTGAASGGRGN